MASQQLEQRWLRTAHSCSAYSGSARKPATLQKTQKPVQDRAAGDADHGGAGLGLPSASTRAPTMATWYAYLITTANAFS
jgi:hypothetical protein